MANTQHFIFTASSLQSHLCEDRKSLPKIRVQQILISTSEKAVIHIFKEKIFLKPKFINICLSNDLPKLWWFLVFLNRATNSTGRGPYFPWLVRVQITVLWQRWSGWITAHINATLCQILKKSGLGFSFTYHFFFCAFFFSSCFETVLLQEVYSFKLDK